jgi:hypothetical protein
VRFPPGCWRRRPASPKRWRWTRWPGAGWLGDHGWATEHDSIAEAAARRLSAEARAPLHASLAKALRRHGGDPAEVARHLAGSGDRSAAATSYAEAAQLALDRYANEEATRPVVQALALRPEEPVRRAILEVRPERRAVPGAARRLHRLPLRRFRSRRAAAPHGPMG